MAEVPDPQAHEAASDLEQQGVPTSQFDREALTLRLSELMGVWQSEWVSSGPYRAHDVLKDTLSQEQLAAERPEQAAYAEFVSGAAAEIIAAQRNDQGSEAIDCLVDFTNMHMATGSKIPESYTHRFIGDVFKMVISNV